MKLVYVLIILMSTNVFASQYNMKDLKALAKAEKWEDVLAHIEDIKPSARNKEWESLLVKAATLSFDKIEKSESYDLEGFLIQFMDKYKELQAQSDFSFKVAKKVRLKISDTRAIKYFQWGLGGKVNAEKCNDDDLKTSLMASLNKNSESEDAKIANKIIFGSCFDSLKETVNASIIESSHSRVLNCKEMQTRNALSDEAKQKCK